MSEDIWKCFTHVEVLRSREPEYFVCNAPINIDPDEDSIVTAPMQSTSTGASKTAVLPVKSFVSILDEGCKKCYDSGPIYTANYIPDQNGLFEIRCEVMGVKSFGKAKTKKAAKQLAAKEALLQIVEKGRHADFGLGATKEIAREYLNGLMPEIAAVAEETCDVNITENWIGKINERCQKKKWQAPQYDVEEKGTPNQPVFIATCTIYKVQTTGTGRTKKQAKTAAAQEMWRRMESDDWIDEAEDELMTVAEEKGGDATLEEKVESPSSDAQEEQLPTKPVDDDEQPLIDFTDKPDQPEREPVPVQQESIIQKTLAALNGENGLEAMEQLLNSGDETIEKVFNKQNLDFMMLSQKDFNGDVQCMLKLLSPNKEVNVFQGTGHDETSSRIDACRNALQFAEVTLKSFKT